MSSRSRASQPSYYILDEQDEVVAVDMLTWAHWLESHRGVRTVLLTSVTRYQGAQEWQPPLPPALLRPRVIVSTVFLGMDHSWSAGPPILWESLIFGGELDGRMLRYASKLDALRGHAALVDAALTCMPRLPRALKRALQKSGTWARRLGPRERRRVARFETRIDRIMEGHA